MKIYDLILRRRSIRRFKNKEVPFKILEKCINAGRLAPSGGNLQPMEFILVDDPNLVKGVFSTLSWARYLKEGAPKEGERPLAYIVIILNRNITQEARHDVGMAAENIILTALGEGITSCCIGTIEREELRKILKVPENFSIELVIALGYAGENSFAEEFKGTHKYWRNSKGVHVPKRLLEDVLHRNGY